MYSIGHFSRMTGLTIKTLRLYHEKGLLEPSWIDSQTGYRYYGLQSVELARAIVYLRELDFSLAEIKEILSRFEEDGELLVFLEKRRQEIRQRLERLDKAAHRLDEIIRAEKETIVMMKKLESGPGEKMVESLQIAGLRWQGRYSEAGKPFSQLGKLAGRYICGKPLNLYYDAEYKEIADIESCFPIRDISKPGALSVRTLPGGRAVYVIHQGPYEQIDRAYTRIMKYIQEKKYSPLLPSREIYLKGPGMIFKGNPKNYITEIQIFIAAEGGAS
jgi:DNA-binding transcriptional MerR regulator/effector-binding domain-containing protein